MGVQNGFEVTVGDRSHDYTNIPSSDQRHCEKGRLWCCLTVDRCNFQSTSRCAGAKASSTPVAPSQNRVARLDLGGRYGPWEFACEHTHGR
jgi:hypothetical protein